MGTVGSQYGLSCLKPTEWYYGECILRFIVLDVAFLSIIILQVAHIGTQYHEY